MGGGGMRWGLTAAPGPLWLFFSPSQVGVWEGFAAKGTIDWVAMDAFPHLRSSEAPVLPLRGLTSLK